jgi:hypothetical protein
MVTTTIGRSGRQFYQRTIPVFLVSVISTIFIVQYFVDWQPLTTFYNAANSWGIIISTMILLFGSVVLLLWQGRAFMARKTRKDFFNSSVFLGTMALFVVFGIWSGVSVSKEPFLGVYSGSLGNISTGLWMCAYGFAGWETIKVMSYIRSLDGLFFLIGFLPSCFFNMTLLLYLWPPFFTIGNWIIVVPNTAVTRVATIVAAVGGVALGIRAIMGKEPGLIEMEMK